MRSGWWLIGALGLLGAGCSDDGNGKARCTYGDKTFEEGEVITAPDGCNTCTCSSQGEAQCGTGKCVDCTTKDGKPLAIGESAPAGDGCNICVCKAKDQLECTTTQCGPTTGTGGGAGGAGGA